MNKDHGSPYDRGGADFWYHRPRDPHWYPEGTYRGERIDPTNGMTEQEIKEYHLGYDDAEEWGEQKDWG